MVNFRRLASHAKRAVDAAGGPDAVKQKAADLQKVAKGPGTLSDKAKRAAEVVREQEEGPTGGRPAEQAAGGANAAGGGTSARDTKGDAGGPG